MLKDSKPGKILCVYQNSGLLEQELQRLSKLLRRRRRLRERRRRKTNREMAMEKLKEGNVDAASNLFQKTINITPSMAHQSIQVLRSENVEFVVAPYVADAQLAYLSSLGEKDSGIQAISEDSDLLAYGCPSKCVS